MRALQVRASALALLLLGLSSSMARAAPVLHDQGRAPEFQKLTGWINSPPLSLAGLGGRVVLVEFWTYACVSCIRSMSHANTWHTQYKHLGLTVIGIHTPEFSFEREARNVLGSIKRLDVDYAVAQDNRYATWTAFSNQYWPAVYLIDRKGRIRYRHVGEGKYHQTEQAILHLLTEK